LCAQHLADLGADVIKIEDRQRGDYARPALRRLVNRNKRALRLDLKKAEGVALFGRLARSADVVVEGFRPGVMSRLGVGYEVLSAENPRLVYCAITGYGQDGPYRDVPGHDLNYCGLAGIVDDMGRPDDPPALSSFLIGDILGGTLNATVGILAALVDVRRTGKGCFVDVAMADGVLAHNVLALAAHNEGLQIHGRGRGTHTGGNARYGLYATADGRYISVAAQEKPFWDALCDVIDRADLKDKHAASGEPGAPVRVALEDAFGRYPLAYWQERLNGTQTCAEPVLTLAEALDHPQFVARGMVMRSGVGEASFALPVKMSGFTCSVERDAPTAGQDTDSILGELGLGSDDIAQLRRSEVI
jgi:crotonobetainyl-CoA:carnitine CoA-transferase CaiB-like acyl-CoA transferase